MAQRLTSDSLRHLDVCCAGRRRDSYPLSASFLLLERPRFAENAGRAVIRMSTDATELLHRWKAGDRAALDELIHRLHGDLRRTAGALLRGERRDHTLQPTALVNEAYTRLWGHTRLDLKDRAHFLAMTARVMRQVLVDYARKHQAARRQQPVGSAAVSAVRLVGDGHAVDLIDLDLAIQASMALDSRQARVVELKYFAGLENDEIAVALDISESTVKREWATARLWLYRQLTRVVPS